MNIYSTAINLVFSVTGSFRNHLKILICSSINNYYYYPSWKPLFCIIFLCILILWWIEWSKHHLLQIFCNIRGVTSITFDQFIVSLRSKIYYNNNNLIIFMINYINTKIVLSLNICKVVYIFCPVTLSDRSSLSATLVAMLVTEICVLHRC